MKTSIEEDIFRLKANVEEHEEKAVKTTVSKLLYKIFRKSSNVKPKVQEVIK